MLTGNTGRLQLSIRPRRIPSGEEIITIHVPPEFSVRLIQPDDLHERYLEIAAPVVRPTTTDIPRTACEISSKVADQNDAYPRFTKSTVILRFPAVEKYLSSGWAEFRFDYTAPQIAGKYRLFGSDHVWIAGGRPQDAVSFEIDPIIVSGEVSPLYLSGITFTSPNTPLRFPELVSTVMTRRIDPYTNQERPDLPTINAICYLASSDEGRYLIPGVEHASLPSVACQE
jgi:hypothetical protein